MGGGAADASPPLPASFSISQSLSPSLPQPMGMPPENLAEYTSSDKADELRGVQEPEYVRLCHPSLGLKMYTCLKQPGSVSQTGAGNPDFIPPHRVRDLCPGAQHHLLGVQATRHCGPHPLSLGYSTRSERDFPQPGFWEPHTVPRDGMSIHHLPDWLRSRLQRFISDSRSQKPTAGKGL